MYENVYFFNWLPIHNFMTTLQTGKICPLYYIKYCLYFCKYISHILGYRDICVMKFCVYILSMDMCVNYYD